MFFLKQRRPPPHPLPPRSFQPPVLSFPPPTNTNTQTQTPSKIFLEPEGRNTPELYVQGFSTGLPERLQRALLRTLPGLEKCAVLRPAYAVEYDYLPATQCHATLETKRIGGLFFSGQLNGTTGEFLCFFSRERGGGGRKGARTRSPLAMAEWGESSRSALGVSRPQRARERDGYTKGQEGFARSSAGGCEIWFSDDAKTKKAAPKKAGKRRRDKAPSRRRRRRPYKGGRARCAGLASPSLRLGQCGIL